MGEIKAALTREEWQAGAIWTPGENPQIAEVDRDLPMLRFHDARTEDRSQHTTFVTPGEFAGIMALANDVIPDGNPSKFTHADVELLRTAIAVASQTGDAELTKGLNSIRRRLAALLPPSP